MTPHVINIDIDASKTSLLPTQISMAIATALRYLAPPARA